MQHMKRPALQNKLVVVLRMAFRARKVLGTFEKRAPGCYSYPQRGTGTFQSLLLWITEAAITVGSRNIE